MTGFRFPPIDAEVRYEPIQRACFRVLFDLTRTCLQSLIQSSPTMTPGLEVLRESLRHALAPRVPLFGPHGQSHTPFEDPRDAFSSSFFNLFHYDHGLLNVHKDRCLITAIYAAVARGNKKHSALWVRDASGCWTDVDAQLENGEVVILVGEDMAHLAAEAGMSLYAAEHCIRVDPEGENIARAHFRPDPATPAQGNRASVAFILSESKVARDEG